MTVSEADLKNPLHWIRWSLNAGIMTDQIKDTLYGYAYLIHPDIKAAEVSIDLTVKAVDYKVYVSKKIYGCITAYRSNVQSGGIIALWKARRLVKKHGNLELEKVLKDFVNRFCGPGWSTNLTIDIDSNYVSKDKTNEHPGDGSITNR